MMTDDRSRELSGAVNQFPAPVLGAGAREALEQAKAALIKIRACSIVGCEQGYGRPEIWADGLFASHADVASALKVIDAALADTVTDTAQGQPEITKGVMQAADKAAQVVEGWSDSKRDYAERVTASPVSSTDRAGK